MAALRTLAAMLGVFLAALASAATPEQLAGDLFTEVLWRDDLAFLSRVAEGDPRSWLELREAIDTLECISVQRADWSVESVSEERVSLRLDLYATGATKAQWRPVRPLPRWWFVDVRKRDSGWRIERAMTAERRLALTMTTAPSPEEARRLLTEAADVDRARVLSLYVTEPAVADRLELLDAAVALAESLGDVPAEVVVRRQRARCLVGKKPREAIEASQDLERFARTHGGPDEQALAALTLGYAHLRAGEVNLAVEVFTSGAGLIERCDDPIVALKCLYMIGQAEDQLKNHVRVLTVMDRLTALSEHYGWEEGEDTALLRKATTHNALGNLELARESYEEVIRLSSLRGNLPSLAAAKHNLASILLGEKKWDEALRLEREAMLLTSNANHLPNMISRVITALIYKGALDEAEVELRRSEGLPRGDDVRRHAHADAGRAIQWSELRQRQGRLDEAIAEARRVFAIEDPVVTGDDNIQWLARLAHGKALRAAGRLDEAVVAYRDAIQIAEARRFVEGIDPLARVAVAEQNLFRYAEFIDLLLEKNEPEQALRVADQMKSRALREVIAAGPVDPSAFLTAEERAQAKALGQRVVDLNREVIVARAGEPAPPALTERLALARQKLAAFHAEMGVRHPGTARRRVEDTGAIVVPEGLVVLLYVLDEKSSVVFAVSGANGTTSIQATRLAVSAAEVEADAQTLARLIANRSPRYRDAAQRLYAALLAPVESLLEGKKAVCLIPDGALWTVPFHALVSGDGAHLIDRHAVFYAHSLALIGPAAAPAVSDARLIAFGNPTVGASARSTLRSMFRDASFGSLIDAETEVRTLASMYSPARSRAYIRDAAQEGAFKHETPAYGIIHIAAHAFVDRGSPMYSAIALAGSSADANEDGLLEAREVVELQLSAQLAVLSACETAGTHASRGEGIVGLSWAFSAAGCPTTVASQWVAESKATSRLMIELHRRLLAGDTTAEALRAAQLSLRQSKQWRHPFYWAPFMAIGAAHRPVAQPRR